MTLGQHVGAVDHVSIKLTKNDPLADDQNHYIKLEMVSAIEGSKLTLSVPSAEAIQMKKKTVRKLGLEESNWFALLQPSSRLLS